MLLSRAEQLAIYKQRKQEQDKPATTRRPRRTAAKKKSGEKKTPTKASRKQLHSRPGIGPLTPRDNNARCMTKKAQVKAKPVQPTTSERPSTTTFSNANPKLIQISKRSKKAPKVASKTSTAGAGSRKKKPTKRKPAPPKSSGHAESAPTTTKAGKASKFVKIRVRLHNKQRWRDISTKKSAPFSQLVAQLKASLRECAALELVSGVATMKPEFYSAADCTALVFGAEYIVHSHSSKERREQELVRFEAALALQTWYRQVSQTQRFRSHKEAVTRTQSVVRMQKARKMALRKRRAIEKIQTSARAHQWQTWYQSLRRNTTLLQQKFRFLRLRKCTVKLQALWRRWRIEQLVRRWSGSATKIQAFQRKTGPRSSFQLLKQAAVAVQRAWRLFQWRVYEQRCTGGAVAAQQVGRGWIVRRRMKTLSRFFQAGLLKT